MDEKVVMLGEVNLSVREDLSGLRIGELNDLEKKRVSAELFSWIQKIFPDEELDEVGVVCNLQRIAGENETVEFLNARLRRLSKEYLLQYVIYAQQE